MPDGGVEGVPLVEVRVHPFATPLHVRVIVGSWKRGEHEEGGLIRLDDFHEVSDVLRDLLGGVEGEADDIPRVDHNTRLVPLTHDVLVRLTLFCPLLSTFRFSGSRSPCRRTPACSPPAARRTKSLGLRAKSTCIMKVIGMPSSVRRRMSASNSFSPVLLPGEVVVGEEIVVDAVLAVVGPHQFRDPLWRSFPHRAPLHVDDRAEATGEGTALEGLHGPKGRPREVLHRGGAGNREGGVLDVHQALEILRERIQALWLAVQDVGQDALPSVLRPHRRRRQWTRGSAPGCPAPARTAC